MKLDKFRECMTLLTTQKVEDFGDEHTQEIDIKVKVWYYHDSDACWETRYKIIVKDYCVVVIGLASSSRDFNNYLNSDGIHSWERDCMTVNMMNSYITKDLDSAITKINQTQLNYIYNNYEWEDTNYELVYQIC